MRRYVNPSAPSLQEDLRLRRLEYREYPTSSFGTAYPYQINRRVFACCVLLSETYLQLYSCGFDARHRSTPDHLIFQAKGHNDCMGDREGRSERTMSAIHLARSLCSEFSAYLVMLEQWAWMGNKMGAPRSNLVPHGS